MVVAGITDSIREYLQGHLRVVVTNQNSAPKVRTTTNLLYGDPAGLNYPQQTLARAHILQACQQVIANPRPGHHLVFSNSGQGNAPLLEYCAFGYAPLGANEKGTGAGVYAVILTHADGGGFSLSYAPGANEFFSENPSIDRNKWPTKVDGLSHVTTSRDILRPRQVELALISRRINPPLIQPLLFEGMDLHVQTKTCTLISPPLQTLTLGDSTRKTIQWWEIVTYGFVNFRFDEASYTDQNVTNAIQHFILLDENIISNGWPTNPIDTRGRNDMKLNERQKNTILDGVPGTGKTYLASQPTFAADPSKVLPPQCKGTSAVTMHPATSYEDFIEGIRPSRSDSIYRRNETNLLFPLPCRPGPVADSSGAAVDSSPEDSGLEGPAEERSHPTVEVTDEISDPASPMRPEESFPCCGLYLLKTICPVPSASGQTLGTSHTWRLLRRIEDDASASGLSLDEESLEPHSETLPHPEGEHGEGVLLDDVEEFAGAASKSQMEYCNPDTLTDMGEELYTLFEEIDSLRDEVMECLASLGIDVEAPSVDDNEFSISLTQSQGLCEIDSSVRRLGSWRLVVQFIGDHLHPEIYFMEHPVTDAAGEWQVRPGFFLRNCIDAVGAPDRDKYVLLDEINRSNTPKVLGDLLTVLEESKRGRVARIRLYRSGRTNPLPLSVWNLGDSRTQTVTLQYSEHVLFVPENMYIVGTRNTSDRSVVSMDSALRRRFTFHRLEPDFNGLRGRGVDADLDAAIQINELLSKRLGDESLIGHSYFYGMVAGDEAGNWRIWRGQVIPQIEHVLQQHRVFDDPAMFRELNTCVSTLPGYIDGEFTVLGADPIGMHTTIRFV
jgi:hypothetical protein